MVFRKFIVSSVCGLTGVAVGSVYERQKRSNQNSVCSAVIQRENESFFKDTKDLEYVSPFIKSLLPRVSAASHLVSDISPMKNTPSSPTRLSEIMHFGFPAYDPVRSFENYVVLYDRRNRTAHWVFEHIKPEHVEKNNKSDRKKCDFKEDISIHPFFRSSNDDYKNSGYDRGHLAAAANHRHSQTAMEQTFYLSNVSPQVGKGFNRDIWNDLEKYVRAVARKNRNVYVCTGPLYLPRLEPDGKIYVKYEVIGKNNVSVPTHFFKVLVIENNKGEFELLSFLLPNQNIEIGKSLKQFLVPVNVIERAAGFLLFEGLPKNRVKSINGKGV